MKRLLLIIGVCILCVPFIAAGGTHKNRGHRGNHPPFVKGHVIVKFRGDATEKDKNRARSLVEGRKGRRLKRVGIELVDLPPGSDEERAVEVLSRDPDVERVQVDPKVDLLGATVLLGSMTRLVPDDGGFIHQWYLDSLPFQGQFPNSADPVGVDVDIDAPEAWAVMAGMFGTSTAAAVGVVDSGCGEEGTFDPADGYHPNHADLPNSVLFSNTCELPADGLDSPADRNTFPDDANGWDFIDADNTPADIDTTYEFHGTLISGIIGAAWDNGLGIAGAGGGYLKVLPLRSADSFFDVIAAVEYAVSLREDGQPVRVLNMSFRSDDGIDPVGLREAVSLAGDNGIAVVAAAGNSGPDNNDDSSNHVWPAEYTKDPDISNVLAVASTGPAGSLSYFSNIGPNSVQMAAPGESIFSVYGGTDSYASVDGTSFSTPIAGAVLGLVMAAHPGLSPALAIDRVVQGGDFDARLAGLIQSGKRVNMAGALAPFHPYSGLAYLGEDVTISMYPDAESSYGNITPSDLDVSMSTTPPAAALVSAGASTLTLTPEVPGIAQFSVNFDGPSAPSGNYDTGPWRVTAISPFTAQVTRYKKVTFRSLLPGNVSWSVSDPSVASISGDGVLKGLSAGRTRVILSVDGVVRDYSGWILVLPAPSGGGCGTTFSTPTGPQWPGAFEMMLTGLLLLGLRKRWLRKIRV